MKKSFKPRKNGYYWVGWRYSSDMQTVVERIAFWNSNTCSWTLDGDERRYIDINFIAIDETPITRKLRLSWYWQLLANVIAGLVLASLASGLLWIVAKILDVVNHK